MESYGFELKLPKERIAVLIGIKGDMKKQIEDATSTRLNIDSKEGDVYISGEDAMGLYNAREIVKAIGRGFNPEYALLLLNSNYILDILTIEDWAPIKSKQSSLRLKGRVIGKGGRSREIIEGYTQTHVCVYGKTISIIGESSDVEHARQAVVDLLRGSPHGNVYKRLSQKRKKLKKGNL